MLNNQDNQLKTIALFNCKYSYIKRYYMNSMGFSSKPTITSNSHPTVYHHSTYTGGKLSVVIKSQLVKVTTEEIKSLRPAAYKYLLP